LAISDGPRRSALSFSMSATLMLGLRPLYAHSSSCRQQHNWVLPPAQRLGRLASRLGLLLVVALGPGFDWNRMIRPSVVLGGAQSGGHDMHRLIATCLLLVASAVTASAQGLFPSVWQTQRGALLKVLWVDAGGNFTGVFISSPAGPCPAVPYNVGGSVRGPRVVFQTSRNWTSDCNVTTNWSGRFVSPTTVVARGSATFAGRRALGTEVFQRI
jgi:hypothetical protein